MKITIIGAGPVGLVTGLVFAVQGKHQVTFVDQGPKVLAKLKKGKLPFYEKGLKALLKKALKKKRLTFYRPDELTAKKLGQVTFVCVGTEENGQTETAPVINVVKQICDLFQYSKTAHTVLIKSTLPPQTFSEKILPLTQEHAHLEVALNPEFLREGQAVSDFLQEERVLIGAENLKNKKTLKKLYRFHPRPQFFFFSPTQAELTKSISNSFFAALISLGNDWGRMVEQLQQVELYSIIDFLSLDQRMKSPQALTSYLRPGVGFGGSCLKKDVLAFEALAQKLRVPTPLLSAIIPSNLWAQKNVLNLCQEVLDKHWVGKTIALLGLSFKPQTSDTRASVGVLLAREFLKRGAQVVCHDPKARLPAELKSLGAKQVASVGKALAQADLCMIASDEKKYGKLEEKDFIKKMKTPVIVDGRGVLEKKSFKKAKYYSIGKSLHNVEKAAQAIHWEEENVATLH